MARSPVKIENPVTNVEKLRSLGILGDVRQRLNATDENDDSKDYRINGMSNNQLIAAWVGWTLGDEGWFWEIAGKLDQLNDMEQ